MPCLTAVATYPKIRYRSSVRATLVNRPDTFCRIFWVSPEMKLKGEWARDSSRRSAAQPGMG